MTHVLLEHGVWIVLDERDDERLVGHHVDGVEVGAVLDHAGEVQRGQLVPGA